MKWNHPKLGDFAFDPEYQWWTGTLEPKVAWKRLAEQSIDVTFETESESPPSTEHVAALAAVLANWEDLPNIVVCALWADINGEAPPSGMWWHGDIAAINEEFVEEGLTPIKASDDLYAILELEAVTVSTAFHGVQIELGFESDLDEEHGVGVLIEASAVVGIGYRVSVTPFKQR